MGAGVSIIVCCYNSVARLHDTINHIVRQKTDNSFAWELIIVDNASTDNTFDLANEILQKSSILFQVVKENTAGLSSARRKGFSVSKFDCLLYCDDDNWLAENYVQGVFEIMKANEQIAILGGMGEAVFESIEPSWFKKLEKNFAVGDQSASKESLSKVTEVYGAGFTVRKSFLQQLFNSGIQNVLSDRSGGQLISGGDTEWCYLARYFGKEVWYSRDLKFKHLMTTGRMSWDYLKKLYFGFGRTNIYTYAYRYVEKNNRVPNQNLRLSFWFDTWLHKAKATFKFYITVIGKLNEEGNEDVLRYYGMRGEISELWKLKAQYSQMFEKVYKNVNVLKQP